MTRNFPFHPSASARAHVQKAHATRLQDLQERAMESMLSIRNRLHLTHGRKWTQPSNEFGSDGDLQVLSAEVSIPFERIANADLSLIDESMNSIFEQLHDAQQRAFYQMISDTCDRSGNSVSAAANGFPEAFCQMLEKMELSVSEGGDVELPQLHTGSDPEALRNALERGGEEYKQRVDEIIARKSAAAFAAEQQRLGKFRRPAE